MTSNPSKVYGLKTRPRTAPSAMRVVVLSVRPEDLAPAEDGLGFSMQVVELLGSDLLLTGTTEGQSLRVVVPPGTAVRGGETIPLRPNLAHVVWMHAETGEALAP